MSFAIVAGFGVSLLLLLEPASLDNELLYQQAQDLAEVNLRSGAGCGALPGGSGLGCCINCNHSGAMVERGDFVLRLWPEHAIAGDD
jgi:hypothetical protein